MYRDSNLWNKYLVSKAFDVKTKYQQEVLVTKLNLKAGVSYLILGKCGFQTGSTTSYSETRSISNANIDIFPSDNIFESFGRIRTIGDFGGGAVTIAMLYKAKSNSYAQLSAYGYYNDPRGYQEIHGKLIAIPIQLG